MAANNTSCFESDHIFLDGYELACQVGDTPEERAFPQVVTLSLKIYLPLKDAGKQDDIQKTVNYVPLLEQIKHLLEKKSFVLIEGVAEAVAGVALNFDPVQSVTVHVSKKVFPGIRSLGASVTRHRAD